MKHKHITYIFLVQLLFFSFVIPSQALAKGKKEVEFWGWWGSGVVSVGASLVTWGFGLPLQGSMLIHVGALHLIDGDPYDPNYDEVFVPVLHDAPNFDPEGGATQEMADTLNGILDSDALAIDYMRAFRVTQDRFYSARLDGDRDAELLQRAALYDYLDEFSQHSLDAASQSNHLFNLLDASSLTNPLITVQEMTDFWTDISNTGVFPSEEESYFNALDLTALERQAILDVTQDFLNGDLDIGQGLQDTTYFDAVPYISRSQELNGSFVMIDLVPEAVPGPSSLLLFLPGLVGIRLCRKWSKVAIN
jgi:hypothetical protein